ncbi:MAG: hypothetical protein EOP00_19900, partial [Pedobacter sp.]
LTLGCFLNPEFTLGQSSISDNPNTITFILVRHAEKADNSPNTNLSEAGKSRAQALAKLLSKVKVDAIYTTSLNRTQQTAQWVAEQNNLKIQTYDMDSKFPTMTDKLAKKHAGKTILIVGHSNTLPVNIARLTKKELSIPESEFDNLFIVNLYDDDTTQLLQLKYGD